MVSDLFAPASRASRGVTRSAYMGRASLAKASFPPHCLRRARTGIYGIGDVAGVEGDCDGAGTGVVGESTGGKGVIGESVSAADIGVYRQSLAVSPSPLPASPDQEYLGRATTLVFLERAPGEEASSGIASRRLRSESTGKAWLYRPVRAGHSGYRSIRDR